MIKNKKGIIEGAVKHLLWLAMFILLGAGLYFLVKFLTTV